MCNKINPERTERFVIQDSTAWHGALYDVMLADSKCDRRICELYYRGPIENFDEGFSVRQAA